MRAGSWCASLLCAATFGAATWGFAPTAAYARDCTTTGEFSTCLDVENLWMRSQSGRFISFGTDLTTPPGQVSVGLWTSYAHRPLVLKAGSADPDGREVAVIDNLASGTFVLALGVTDALEITAAAPVTFYEDGAGYEALLGGDKELPRSTVRDARFGVAYAFVQRERKQAAEGFGLLGRFEFSAPFGDGEAFAGARTGTAIPSVSADYRIDRFTFGGEVGARIRGETALGPVVWGTQLFAGLGASVEVYAPLGLSLSAEAFALPTLAAQDESVGALVPSEWIVSAKIAPFLAGDVSFGVFGGGPIPLTDSAATAARVRAGFSISYTPLALDSDGDGIPDRDDACPLLAEDKDAFEDADGCPDPDNDDDGIPDVRDRCRDAAETMDGFQDEDGCPDNDDDGDGIPDAEDQCRNEKEDRDGFQDEDGCPDPDNDNDGIPDAEDQCPTGPEDMDGFRDEDGCPDPDNDADGIPDVVDQCPNDPEDKDGFQDDDGCPDPDNDRDGVPDALDKCPLEAETLNGTDDDDGCPEPGATSLVRLEGQTVRFGAPPSFPVGSARLSPNLSKALELAAKLLAAGGPGMVVVIEGYADQAGASPAAAALAARRADAARAIFVRQGIAQSDVTAASGDPGSMPKDGSKLEISISKPVRSPAPPPTSTETSQP